MRDLDPASLSEVEIAARFLFLNKLCFNGIYRTNMAGRFNVPYAKPKRRRVLFDFDTLNKTALLLKNASLFHGDFEAILGEARAGDFVYLDPPYAVAKRRVFSEYQAQGFSERDLDRLRSCLVGLDRKGVHFVLVIRRTRRRGEDSHPIGTIAELELVETLLASLETVDWRSR